MEVRDDDPEEDGDDLIDQFIITILDIVSDVNESEPMIIEGEKEFGLIIIAYYNFTTDQRFNSCSSEVTGISRAIITSSPSKSYTCILCKA